MFLHKFQNLQSEVRTYFRICQIPNSLAQLRHQRFRRTCSTNQLDTSLRTPPSSPDSFMSSGPDAETLIVQVAAFLCRVHQPHAFAFVTPSRNKANPPRLYVQPMSHLPIRILSRKLTTKVFYLSLACNLFRWSACQPVTSQKLNTSKPPVLDPCSPYSSEISPPCLHFTRRSISVPFILNYDPAYEGLEALARQRLGWRITLVQN